MIKAMAAHYSPPLSVKPGLAVEKTKKVIL